MCQENGPGDQDRWNEDTSDVMTKHFVGPVIDKHLEFLNIWYREGRADKAAKLHEIHRAERYSDCKQSYKNQNYDNLRSDHWKERGQDNKWIRKHSMPRRALFAPYKIPRGPGRKTKLKKIRVTEGVTEDGQEFRIEDDLTKPDNSHKVLAMNWAGSTSFEIEAEEDISLGGDCRRQRIRVDSIAAASCTQGVEFAPRCQRVSWTDTYDSEGPQSERT